ncbi:MAG: zinc-ribbon domain-containing protein [Methanoregula sp.]|jgi:predicted nucleic acid-binding Zn ribbon protein|uniref:zinc ribbon domain-containing protein n=1 Tax=Methanoregula sp. TaxID=2052170 RepID=UPI003D0F4066
MDDPELGSDERVLARAHMVRIKSVLFEAVLTNKRIILVDKIKSRIPTKNILLTTVKDAKPGENAIRDQVITFTILTNTGDTRQIILTFSREGGGNRKKERDEWIRLINDHLTSPVAQVIRKVIPNREPAPKATEHAAVPKIKVVGSPIALAPGHSPGRYCTRCGKRVPDGSKFCSYCGTKITVPDKVLPAPASKPPAVTIKKERPIDREVQFIEPFIRRSRENMAADPLKVVSPDPAARTPASQPVTPAPSPAKPAGERFITQPSSPKGVRPAPPEPGHMTTAVPQAPRKPKSKKKVVIFIGIIVIILIIVAAVVLVLPKVMSGTASAPSSSTAGTPVTATLASAKTAAPEVTPISTVTLQSQPTPKVQLSDTCAKIGGVICSADETCSGSMVNTTDSSRCCAGTCSASS